MPTKKKSVEPKSVEPTIIRPSKVEVPIIEPMALAIPEVSLPPMVQQQIIDLPELAKKYHTITNDNQLKAADEVGLMIAEVLKQIDKQFDDSIERWHLGHKAEIAKKKVFTDKFTTKEKNGSLDLMKREMGRYMLEKEREAEAERKQAQNDLEDLAVLMAEHERLEKLKQLKAQGRTDEAVDLASAPLVAERPAVQQAVQWKPAGMGTTLAKTWSAEIDAPTESDALYMLCKAVVDKKVPIVAIQANMVFLNNQARQMKATFDYPGFKAVESGGARRTGR